ncbi:MAG TPA: tetratricopeptide repeat protein [Pyrinomonadaceae bacterium]|nr:tetratricopeptide repeat protein [Pyrinomonadaceae bacterium]
MRRYPPPHHLFVMLLLMLSAGALLQARAQKPRPTPARTPAAQPAPPPKPKKTPPGAKGFAQYAGRDASDKLLTGAATRGGIGANPAQTFFDEGQRQYAAHDLTKAADAFAHAAKLAPYWAEAHYSLAIVLGELDRWAESAVEFQRALDANPNEQTRLYATYNLGNAELDLGHYDKALAAFQQTTKLAPLQPTPHYNMALAYLGLKRSEEAVAQFKEAIRLKPDYADAHYNLGVLYLQQGQTAAARAEQQRLSTLNAALARRLAALAQAANRKPAKHP